MLNLHDPNEFDNAINILEPYILAANKEAYIKTLVPNSTPHRLVSAMHALNTVGAVVPADVAQVLKKLFDAPPHRSSSQWTLLVRHLLAQLAESDDRARARELITKIDRIGDNKISSLVDFSKPVIFAAGEEFKEDKELDLESSLTSKNLSRVVLSEFVKLVYQNPAELRSTGASTVIYHLDLVKIGASSSDILEYILGLVDCFANLQNVVPALCNLYDLKRKKDAYYRFPEHYFSKLTVEQLKSLGSKVRDETTNQLYSINYFSKYFDVNWESLKERSEIKALLENMVAWVDANLHQNHASELNAIIRYCLLVNGMLMNRFDPLLFKTYIQRPSSIHSKFTNEFRTALSSRGIHGVSSYWKTSCGLPAALYSYPHPPRRLRRPVARAVLPLD